MVTVYLLEEVRNGLGRVTWTYSYDENYNLVAINDDRYFEDFDENGMPEKMSRGAKDSGSFSTLTYTADGKLEMVDHNESPFYGRKYKYDEAGNLIAEEEYADGRLDFITMYEYDGQTLIASHCEFAESGVFMYDTKVENGRIVEKYYKDCDPSMTYQLNYDEHGNLISEISDDITAYSDYYTYKAVQVDAARAPYLREQQRHFIWMA